jgi:hypothetical protein
MPHYRVVYDASVTYAVTVEALNPDEACALAERKMEWGGVDVFEVQP